MVNENLSEFSIIQFYIHIKPFDLGLKFEGKTSEVLKISDVFILKQLSKTCQIWKLKAII
ncbi:MAG: hypothetical protein A2046_15090 [Bacteroidetes bacterium GWA2_30_7]|nr:MAG: hypothetical protein A2046_15090 [Bacteroidetes bacterium GWA2_30_7]